MRLKMTKAVEQSERKKDVRVETVVVRLKKKWCGASGQSAKTNHQGEIEINV